MGTKRKAMTPEAKAILQKQKTISKLRGKVEKGTATEEEAEIVRRAPPPRMTGRRVAKLNAAAPRVIDHDTGAPVDTDAPPEPESAKPPPPPPPPLGSTPPPKGGGQRDTRQAACRQVAEAYCAILTKLSEYIEANGSKPIVTPKIIEETILPAAILTADRFMPADIVIGPETEVVLYSGVALGQAAWVASKKKKRGPALQSVPMPVPFKVAPEAQPIPEPVHTDTPQPATAPEQPAPASAEEVLTRNPRSVF